MKVGKIIVVVVDKIVPEIIVITVIVIVKIIIIVIITCIPLSKSLSVQKKKKSKYF